VVFNIDFLTSMVSHILATNIGLPILSIVSLFLPEFADDSILSHSYHMERSLRMRHAT